MARVASDHGGAFRLRPGKTRCPGCHHTEFEHALGLRSHVVGRCLECGLMVNISFPQEAPALVFDAAYHGDAQSAAFEGSSFGPTDPSRTIWERGLAAVSRATNGRRLLDVGAARGSFVALATARGWDAQGVELAADAASIARDTHGLPVATGTITDVAGDQQFDVITIWDVLEHVTDVAGTLSAAHARLAPGGAVLITTDNFDSLVADLARSAYAMSRGRITFPVERFFIPYNTVYFTPESLRSVLRVHGLHTVHSEGIDYPLAKMNLSAPQRLIARALYAAGEKSGRESQMLVVAQPAEEDSRV